MTLSIPFIGFSNSPGPASLTLQAFSLALVDVDGLELASCHSEGLGSLIEFHPALGNLGDYPNAELMWVADMPKAARGELFAKDKAVGQLAIQRHPRNAEQLLGLGDGDHWFIIVSRCDNGWGRIGGNPGDPEGFDPRLCKRQDPCPCGGPASTTRLQSSCGRSVQPVSGRYLALRI